MIHVHFESVPCTLHLQITTLDHVDPQELGLLLLPHMAKPGSMQAKLEKAVNDLHAKKLMRAVYFEPDNNDLWYIYFKYRPNYEGWEEVFTGVPLDYYNLLNFVVLDCLLRLYKRIEVVDLTFDDGLTLKEAQFLYANVTKKYPDWDPENGENIMCLAKAVFYRNKSLRSIECFKRVSLIFIIFFPF